MRTKNSIIFFLVFSHKKRDFLLSLLISLIMLSLSPVICLADADIIFKENSKAVVVIYAYDKEGNPINQGSGFIVREDGAVVTNYHVISNAAFIKIKAGANKVLNVEGLLYIDKENDLVILKADDKNLPTVKLGDADNVGIGEKVYVIGSPQGFENTISDGILGGIREIGTNMKIFQITAPISEGSSGGPVFNKNSEVIGIATFIIKEAQNLNFAMPVNVIKDKILIKKAIALQDAGIEDYTKSAGYWLYLGYYYDESGKYKESIEAYKQAIRIKPDYAEAHYNLGVTYGNLGMNREAIDAVKQVIRIRPDYAEAHYNLGLTYYKLGMNREAIEAYKQAIRIKPDYAEAHYNLGVTYGNLGMNREAIDAFKQAIRIKPDYAEAHHNLGFTYYKLGMNREAIEASKQAIRIKPDLAEARNNLGVLYGNLGMNREAIDAFKQAIRIKPDYAEAHNNLGYYYDESGNYKESIEAYKQAIRIKPDFAMAHNNLGATYGKLGMDKEAIEAYEQAIRIKPDFAMAHYNLGFYCLILNDRGSALNEYKILKDLDTEKANKLFNLIYK
ncbi:MAG: tetratricopeptide repeat protein [Thermodesulfovibrionales bacterium]